MTERFLECPIDDGGVALEMHAKNVFIQIELRPDGLVECVYVRPAVGESMMWEAPPDTPGAER